MYYNTNTLKTVERYDPSISYKHGAAIHYLNNTPSLTTYKMIC